MAAAHAPHIGSPRLVARRVMLAFWLVLAGILLFAFVRTAHDVVESPGTDLRCRVVGARALMLGLDPYFMPARTDQIQMLQDPDRYAAVSTRCTYTPSLLCLYIPLANLPYQAQRYIWFGLEWCALIESILLLRSVLPSRVTQNVFTVIGVICFADGAFWRLHLERGQYYVFIVLLLSLTARLCLGRSSRDRALPARERWWCGLPLGIAAALRLTPLAALLPLWAAGFRRTAIGAAIAFGVCIIGTLAIAGTGPWQSYFRNVSIQSRLTYDGDYFKSEQAKLPPLPVTAEGMTFGRAISIPCANVTLAMDVLLPLAASFSWMPGADRWQLISRAAAAIVCLLFPLLMRRRRLSPAEKLAGALLCVLSVDFFLPMRISYADILFLVPVGLLIPSMLRQRNGFIWLAVTLTVLAMCDGLFASQLPISLLRPPLVMMTLLGYLASRPAANLRGQQNAEQRSDETEAVLNGQMAVMPN